MIVFKYLFMYWRLGLLCLLFLNACLIIHYKPLKWGGPRDNINANYYTAIIAFLIILIANVIAGSGGGLKLISIAVLIMQLIPVLIMSTIVFIIIVAMFEIIKVYIVIPYLIPFLKNRKKD